MANLFSKSILLLVCLTSLSSGDELVGLWEFDDPENLAKASYGDDLTIMGTLPDHLATLPDGKDSPIILNGVIKTQNGVPNYFIATHAIGPNGGGKKTNQYTFAFDALIPETKGWRSFYQTSFTNQDDTEFAVRPEELTIGRGSGGPGYSSESLTPNRWHRWVISVDLGPEGFFRTYRDGELFCEHTKPAFDLDYALDPGRVLLFADNDGENHPLSIGMVAIFAKALSQAEVLALGGPGTTVREESTNQAPSVIAHPNETALFQTGTEQNFTLTINDAEGDSVQAQADWGNGLFSPWTPVQKSGSTLALNNRWNLPGDFAIRVRGRDATGSLSPWIALQKVTVTGLPILNFLTPPYLQNMGTDRMVVMWETAEDFPLDLKVEPPNGSPQIVTGERTPSGGNSFFHRALVTGLNAGTTYQYQIISTEGALTKLASFRTAPDTWEDVTFMAIGDIQTDNQVRTNKTWAWKAGPWEPAKTMLHHMVGRNPGFLLALGDHADDGNSYDRTRLSHLDRTASIFGPHAPFFIAWGNHDGNSPHHPLRLSADMPSRWQVDDSPSLRTPGYGNYWFTYSGIFFVCLEYFQTHNRPANDPSNDITNGWLDRVLSSPEAQKARFRIVAVHHPVYAERWIDGNANLRETLAPRLEKYQVALCLSGHMHGYERGRINGVQYVISGCGSYLDFNEPLVADWSATTDDGLWLGGHKNVPGNYASQSAPGILGEPQPIIGGLFHGYSEITVKDRSMRLDQHAFNADGSYLGIVDTINWNSPIEK